MKNAGEQFSSVSQQYHNPFNFKKAKNWKYVAGIIKSAGEHFLCHSRILQSTKLQGSKRMKDRSWNYQERLTTIFSFSQKCYNLFNFKEAKNWNNITGSIMNAEHFHYQTRTLQLFQLQGSKRMKQYSWNYQERRRTFPLSLNNTTVSITSRKKKKMG